ncbi:similar to Saccharomyces cerevisiae YHR009C TDA3 Putative oxidoreductase involved in late endosome to Golgi transport [Maudiozyma barnettii]|uniref:Similar to Saccharomyces cerevisiae YHR009C TDA3 Putative oxidoreductase involved in late endosome to Golgi transport n=1 Tax=Maudiozyma barnettii TaxID=61262 RepID=A0A8H2VJ20_9SACH|nr:Tda3p [Kazachstania barnettii]CAB4256318.1 similar to Saccharomyces cerevisiae YHR009C TDA3 Putative oxidoreductase involved in late endosome to Golgi transport [Kazachstania barnettii]CAD1784927.1 similar to Saccharomyces cerevisiae YHR009C TDA3 Putative oxidoreductase involved in late endosome to Golgi transport [Kazachstania barnettii]
MSEPSKEKNGKIEIAIIGAGIIGCCTAYYLTRHPKFSPEKYHITIYESNEVACAASGKAGGLLANWAFPSQLGALSFDMHKELAEKYDGGKNWDYRVLDTISLEADIRDDVITKKLSMISSNEKEKEINENSEHMNPNTKKHLKDMLGGYSNASLNSLTSAETNNSDMLSSIRDKLKISDTQSDDTFDDSDNENDDEQDTESKNPLPEKLDWIQRDLVDDWSTIGDIKSTAQMHPSKFTKFMLKKAMEVGVVDLIYAKVTGLTFDEDTKKMVGLSFLPDKIKNKKSPKDILSSCKVEETNEDGELQTYDIDNIIVAMGPWTSKLLADCPISGLRAHSITVMPEDMSKISAFAMFTELKVADSEYFSPEIYARRDEIYVCGEGDTLLDLPDPTKDSPIDEGKCEELFKFAGKLSNSIAKGHTLLKQACYLPVLNVPTSSGPLLGQTNVDNLYLASGHSCWGINNSVISGKIMSEVILDGVAASAPIDKLEPKIFFDASQLSSP